MSSLEAVDGFKLELDLVQKIMKHYTHLTNSGKTIIMCPWAIAWHYLRDPTFSHFDTIPESDRHTHTHRHMITAYTTLSITSHGKNGSRDATTPLSGTVCSPYAGTSYDRPVYQNMKSLY